MTGMPDDQESNAAKSLGFCSLFESELLVWLMLRNWSHPLAEDEDFRNQLLEAATEVLNAAAGGSPDQIFIEGVPAIDMNLVAAIWYVEFRAIEDARSASRHEIEARQRWLETVRRTLPSCFCAQEYLS